MRESKNSTFAPYLCVKDAAGAIDFYIRAFGAVEQFRIGDPGQKIGHAELLVNGNLLMLSDEALERDFKSPTALGGSPVTICLIVDDVDAIAARSIAAGARVIRPVENQFYGHRGGLFEDPYGHLWWIATEIEDVSPEELKRRVGELGK
jgi:PhnB protein